MIPMISSILAHPLGSNHPPQLLRALRSLETTVKICWPRMSAHHVEILRGITTCWRYLRNQEDPQLKPVRELLTRITKAMTTISVEAKVDVEAISEIDTYFAELSQGDLDIAPNAGLCES